MTVYLEEKESFSHFAAKELLREWIAENCGFDDSYIECPIQFIDQYGNEKSVNWRSDFVSMEYPITPDFPMNIDETNACKCHWEKRSDFCHYRSNEKYCPCLKCEWFDKNQLLYVVDIAIEHKGIVAAVIEITHKNPLSFEKKKLIHNKMVENCGGLTRFEVNAKHILGQTQKPKQLFVESF